MAGRDFDPETGEITEQNTREGRSGTAREAPSTGSGTEAGASVGAQPAAPTISDRAPDAAAPESAPAGGVEQPPASEARAPAPSPSAPPAQFYVETVPLEERIAMQARGEFVDRRHPVDAALRLHDFGEDIPERLADAIATGLAWRAAGSPGRESNEGEAA